MHVSARGLACALAARLPGTTSVVIHGDEESAVATVRWRWVVSPTARVAIVANDTRGVELLEREVMVELGERPALPDDEDEGTAA